MKAITIFYDARCGLCTAVKGWIEAEPKFVAVHFVPYDSQHAAELFPKIQDWHPEVEVLALSDEGGLYRGNGAWILCLWATIRYRSWSLRLARPSLQPLAEKFCRLIAHNRREISRIFRLRSDARMSAEVTRLATPSAVGVACRTAAGRAE